MRATVSVSQTIDPGETLSDVATSLVADLSGLTNDAGDPLGLSGEVVTVDDGFGGVQTSLQIASANGTSAPGELGAPLRCCVH